MKIWPLYNIPADFPLTPAIRREVDDFIHWYVNNYRGNISKILGGMESLNKDRQRVHMLRFIYGHYTQFRKALVTPPGDIRDQETTSYLKDAIPPEGNVHATCRNRDLYVSGFQTKVKMLENYARVPKDVAVNEVLPFLEKSKPTVDMDQIVMVASHGPPPTLYCFTQDEMRQNRYLQKGNPYTRRLWTADEQRAIVFQVLFVNRVIEIGEMVKASSNYHIIEERREALRRQFQRMQRFRLASQW